MSDSKRARFVTVIAVSAIGCVGAAVLWTIGASSSESDGQAAGPVTEAVLEPGALRLLPAGTRTLVRAADPLTPRMDGGLYAVSRGGDLRQAGELACKQVHASAAGPGLCLALSGDGVRYEGIVFDASYRPRLRFPITGVPDRARVSRDGRYGAFTTFDLGSSQGYFANLDEFSTNTRIVDMRTGKPVVRLSKDLEVTRAGKPFKPEDVQFWGVTFGEDGRFFATMATTLAHYLIEGDVESGRARVVGRHIECPSLSPDERRIAYKRRIRYRTAWRLHVLDLQTGRRVALAERRSIDDQPEWLGNDRIVYSDDRAVFTVPADGSGRVERLARHASSPAFIDSSPEGAARSTAGNTQALPSRTNLTR